MSTSSSSSSSSPAWGLATTAIHAGDPANPTSAVVCPVFQTATYAFDSPDVMAENNIIDQNHQLYGRYGSPNVRQVELTVAALEGGEAASVVASGMAAVSLVYFTFLRPGDHVIAQNVHYPTAINLLKRFQEMGVELTFVDNTDADAFKRAMRPDTRLIYVETPANPVLTLTDLSAVAELAETENRRRGGPTARQVLTCIDNTFASPYNQKPLSFGIDMVLHSATKYLAGHSDVVAGVVVASKAHQQLMWATHKMLGAQLHPQEAWLLERGMKTFDMRMARHNSNAMAIAKYLESHPAVAQVFYPGLPSHPQHALAKRQMNWQKNEGYGGMVCFDLKGGRDAGYSLLQRIRLVKLAVSLGGVHSLITHPASTIVSILGDAAAIARAGVKPGLVRFSVGCEDVNDLIADLKQALDGHAAKM
jgi:methionine-gamma-lyase